MKFINEILKKDPDYGGLLQAVVQERLPLVCTGLSMIHKAAVSAALYGAVGRKIAVITHDEASANELKDDLRSLGLNCLNFPSRDYCIGPLSGYSKEYEHKRTDTLSKLLDGDFDVVTISLDAAVQYTVPPENLSRARFSLKAGDSADITELSGRLISAGYVKSELCEGAGQFSVRGGIFDVFPVNSEQPCRIEFWGDEIDNISYFDTETQRRTENTDKIEITPACEAVFEPRELIIKLNNYLKTAKGLTEKQRSVILKDIDALENGIEFSYDRYIPLIFEGGETVFDYISDALIAVSESGGINDRFRSMAVQQSAEIEAYLEEGYLTEKTAGLWLDKTDFWSCVCGALIMENFPRNSYELKPRDIINFNYKRSTAWSGDINILLEDIAYIRESGGAVVILAGERRAAQVLNAELNEKGINSTFSESHDFMPLGVTVTVGGLSGGFEIPSSRFMLITHRYIASEGKRKKARPKNGQEIG